MGYFISLLGMSIASFFFIFKVKFLIKELKNLKSNVLYNSIDIVILTCMFLVSYLNLQEVLNTSRTGVQGQSYNVYVVILIVSYFIWMNIIVNKYRKKLPTTKKKKRK